MNNDPVLIGALKKQLDFAKRSAEQMTSEFRDLRNRMMVNAREMEHLQGLLVSYGAISKDEESSNALSPFNRLRRRDQRSIPSVNGAGDQSSTRVIVHEILKKNGPMHYKEIRRKLETDYDVQLGGMSPDRTLVARICEDPELYRPNRGTYALKGKRSSNIKSVGSRKSKRRARR